MIRSLNTGPFLEVTNGTSSDPYISNTAPMVGLIRFCNNRFEVYDGAIWHSIGQSFPTISLTNSASDALGWAIKKMKEEEYLLSLPSDNPAVIKAKEHVNHKIKCQ